MSGVKFDEKLERIRSQNPSIFDDRDSAIDFDDYYVFDPELLFEDEELNGWWEHVLELPDEEVTENELESFGGHPGGLSRPTNQPSLDTLAFYLPFHLYPRG